MIIKITGIALLSALSYVLLKKERAEFAFVLELCVTGVLLLLILPYIESVLEMFSEMAGSFAADVAFDRILIKCAGISIISKFITELCKDAGENALSAKLELAARVLILMQTMPIMQALCSLIASLAENLV